jgi:hypothetical protein
MNDLLSKITQAVEKAVGCASAVSHRESVLVTETHRGKVIWEGVIEVFYVDDFHDLDAAYGWAVDSPKGTQFVAILGTPPVDSPQAAVHQWIASQNRK